MAKGRPENVQRFLTPRGSAAMGLVYAELTRFKAASQGQAAEDRRDARRWLEQSLTSWRQLQSDPAFAPAHKKEMQQSSRLLPE